MCIFHALLVQEYYCLLECAGANEINLRILITVFTLADASEVIQAFRHAIYHTEYIRHYLFSAQEIMIGGEVAPPRANFKARDGFNAKLAQQRAIKNYSMGGRHF